MLRSIIVFIMSFRHLGIVKYFANLLDSGLRTYENLNYTFDKNGESWLLQTLGDYYSKIPKITVFDVGGNVGNYSHKIRTYIPNSLIYFFEIVPSTYEKASTNLPSTNIYTYNIGLSDKPGKIDVKSYPQAKGLSSIYEYPHEQKYEIVECDVTTGDKFSAEHKINHIHFLKIDTEGAEHLVLKGLETLLKDKRIDVIQFEYGYINILTKFLLYDFYKLLESYGYTIGKLYPKGVEFKDYEFSDENFWGPNYVAVRSDVPDLVTTLKGKS